MTSDESSRGKKKTEPSQITRRGFIRVVPCAGLGVLLGLKNPLNWSPPTNQSLQGAFAEKDLQPFLPGRLVHVFDEDATSWNFSSSWYGYYVDQSKVDAMVEVGLMRLTAAKNIVSAWERLIPNYSPGQTFAIKVNFNNYSHGGSDPDPEINAIIEPVNALIRTLVMFGVQPSEISVFDVTNAWHSGSMPPNSFINRCLYPGVNFVYHYGNPNPFSSTQMVQFNPPSGPGVSDLAIGNVVVDADYLINMFVPKGHSQSGVTLGFKNHLGSINKCDKVHNYLPSNYYFNPSYSTYVDIFKNPHFGAKTVLNICDGLYGNWDGVHGAPLRWNTFNNDAMNSLFFAADAVAIDSVLTDIIEEERIQQGMGSLISGTRDYLSLAEAEGFGIFESADPFILPMGSDYKRIKYIFVYGV